MQKTAAPVPIQRNSTSDSDLEWFAHTMAYRNKTQNRGPVPAGAGAPVDTPEAQHAREQAGLDSRTLISKEEAEALAKRGYDPASIRHHTLPGGTRLSTIHPAEDRDDLRPVMAFRGTASMADLNADRGRVGLTYFERDQEAIKQIHDDLRATSKRPVDMTGHSLGGAMAQRAYARFYDEHHGKLATFQSASVEGGVKDELADNMRRTEAIRPMSTANTEIRHHISDWDPVTGGSKVIEKMHSTASAAGSFLQGGASSSSPVRGSGLLTTSQERGDAEEKETKAKERTKAAASEMYGRGASVIGGSHRGTFFTDHLAEPNPRPFPYSMDDWDAMFNKFDEIDEQEKTGQSVDFSKHWRLMEKEQKAKRVAAQRAHKRKLKH